MKNVLKGVVEVGQNVIVVALQHHMHGLQMADYLTDHGKTVEILTTSAYAGDRVDFNTLEDIYTRLFSKGATFTPFTGVKGIQGKKVLIYNVMTQKQNVIDGVDTVVFCSHGKPNDGLYYSLKDRVKELYIVGQCASPRELLDSIHDGAFVGRHL
jgi:hypothetical protein